MEERVIGTVSRVNNYIKRLIDSKSVLNNIWVKGEISNYKRHSSGHIYLTLKDEGSILKAVMFRAAASGLDFEPSDGTMVIAHGRISVYEAGGAYQLYIEDMTLDGIGDLYREFEKLKAKLSEEGLFDEQYKKPIPKFPLRIGVATATTGAAVRDIINVITRRYPLAEIVVYPTLVQGNGAKESIVGAIEYFNATKSVDTLIIGRGGGSIEDLWAFNEECVARAIFNSEIPIISAVGHETDFTIADFVSDLRAPTPSAAAEISVPSADELKRLISIYTSRMNTASLSFIDRNKKTLARLMPKNPQDKINELSQKLDMRIQTLEQVYKLVINQKRREMSECSAKLDALSPLKTLTRGYSIPVNQEGTVLRETKDFTKNMDFTLKVKDGDVICMVK
ncbi:MAG: exodeoxyribonuclease VII large subunit [Clostridiales bacterium]|nr:exodeoxyribonuclease VII large subunit [Clostridiales bacterium]